MSAHLPRGRSALAALALATALQLRTSPGEAQAGDDTPVEARAPAPDAPASVRLLISGGAGVGTRGLRRPTMKGAQRLRDAMFPALDIGLRVVAWPDEGFSLAFAVRYQTSLGLEVEDDPSFAPPTRVAVRAERVEVAAAPGLRLGDSPRAMLLSVPLGLGVRTFWPHVHDLPVVGYSLLGPFVRPELSLALGDALTVRIGLEGQWIVAVDRVLQLDGVAATGFGLGGEVGLKVPLGRKLALDLSYRQVHAIVPGQLGKRDLVDVERFATAGLTGTL